MTPAPSTSNGARSCCRCRARSRVHPETGKPILAGIGRYGPYVQHGKTYANLGRDDDVLEIGGNRAIDLIVTKESGRRLRRGARAIPAARSARIRERAERSCVKAGRFGPYVTDGETNATLPRDMSQDAVTLEEALGLLAGAARRWAPRVGRVAAGAPRRKAPANRRRRQARAPRRQQARARRKPPQERGESRRQERGESRRQERGQERQERGESRRQGRGDEECRAEARREEGGEEAEDGFALEGRTHAGCRASLAPAMTAFDHEGMQTLVRLLAALAAGMTVGLNRNLSGKSVGLRTLGLVAMGSALVILAGVGPNGAPFAPDAVSRVIQGVLTGVGFVGAGVILHGPRGRTVHGLTTAASVWIAAALGIAAGLGAWVVLVVGFGLTLFTLTFGRRIEALFGVPADADVDDAGS